MPFISHLQLFSTNRTNSFYNFILPIKSIIFFHKHNFLRHFSTKQQQSQSQLSRYAKELDVELLNKCQLEFNSGAGGTEAALFTSELYSMYKYFAEEQNTWIWRPIEVNTITTDNKIGIRSAIVQVKGDWCYAKLRFEGGVHRVQRKPLTDKSRIHTSTASLAVLPEPEKPELMFTSRDIRVENMRSSGPGGSNVNAKSTAVRITHIPTGISIKAQDERYLQVNEKLALERLSAILLKRQMDQINRNYSGNRKLQVGSLERAEKIRTYNFKDNQVIDHRLKKSFIGVKEFLQTGDQLEQVIDLLMEMYEMENTETKQFQAKESQCTEK